MRQKMPGAEAAVKSNLLFLGGLKRDSNHAAPTLKSSGGAGAHPKRTSPRVCSIWVDILFRYIV